MTYQQRRRLAEARKALQKLADRYTKPRRLEADLDILASALRKVPRSLTGVLHNVSSFDLCDILHVFAEADLVSFDAVTSCRELTDLAEMADYEIGEEEEFGNQTEGSLEVLKEELDAFLKKFEANQKH